MIASHADSGGIRRAARWLAAGLVLLPIVDVADDSGAVGAVASFDGAALASVPPARWAAMAFFAVLGFAIARLLGAQSPGGRRVVMVGCAIPLAIYAINDGFGVATLAAALVLGFGTWQLHGAEQLE